MRSLGRFLDWLALEFVEKHGNQRKLVIALTKVLSQGDKPFHAFRLKTIAP